MARDGQKIAHWCKTHAGELLVRAVFDHVVASSTAAPSDGLPPPPLVLDIGANYGYYGLWMAADSTRHCRVVAFDPQPSCHRALRFAVERSNIDAARYTLIEHAVAYPVRALPVSPQTHCVGQFPNSVLSYQRGALTGGGIERTHLVDAFYNGLGVGEFVDNATTTDIVWSLQRTVDVVDVIGASERVVLAKIDTEGNEMSVLASLYPLATQERLDNIVVELSYGEWSALGVSHAHARALLGAYVRLGFVALPLRHGDTMRTLHTAADVVAWLQNATENHAQRRADDGQVDMWLSRTVRADAMLRALGARAFACDSVG